ncbi:MAG: ankyrin repeat domain-containing protein [Armatimonadetes bacterium]|nr:ankyrin repeat domain-containing protein [Armatimonadota bacterium]
MPDFPFRRPRLDPKLVKAFVIAAHSNLPAVKEMLEAEPGLLNATVDWGNGDFEQAIEGAGHMGNRDIALYLLSKGARMNLFCAAMLGELDYVKAVLTAHPNLKDSLGPHKIPLLKHCEAGGEHAVAVLEYVKSLG